MPAPYARRPSPTVSRPRSVSWHGSRKAPGARPFRCAETGTAAVEFAILAPMLLLLLLGIVVYGGYFLMAHAVQQLANDSARAALAGLSDVERQQLAANCMASELPTYGFIDPKLIRLTYASQAQVMTVGVAYDASSSPVFALSGVVPMPSAAIARTASVQLGGF